MRILNDDDVLDYIDSENNNVPPNIYMLQIQVHIDYPCGCKITQNATGSSLFPCERHKAWAHQHADNKTLHKVLH